MNSTELTGRGAVRCVLAALAAVVVAGAPAAAQGPLALGIDTTAFDHSVRPQDDFFAFVNGGWLARTEIPADRAVWGTFNELGELSENAIREILEEAAAARNPQRGSDVQKLGDFYASFLDTARIERLGMRPLQPELRAIRALRSRAEFPAFLSGMAGRGLGGPFGMGVSQDAKASDQYAIYLSQAGLGLPDRDFYFNDGERFETIRSAYVAYLETLLREAGEADPAGAAQAVMALETQIAEHHWDRTRNRDRDATYNRMTLAELQAAAPGFDWAAYFGGVGLQGVDAVVVRQPSYLPAMDALMGSTPIETWRAYYTVRLVDAAAPYLPRAVGDAQFEFRGRTLQGLEEQRDRARRGVQVVQGGLGEVLGKMYVERHFRPEAKARMEALVGNLLEAFRQGIDDLEWMSPATKAEAHDKLAKFTPRVGYPERWRDYGDVQIRRDDLLGNVRSAGYAAFRRMIDRWGTPVERGEWGMTPQTVNAYYSSVNNEIVFPAAILQPPFFDLSADDAVNYGAIGGVIGHEISHGFDDQGRKSDGDGNLRDWWTDEDRAAFEARANLLVEQYGEFCPFEGACVNGRLALGENIGDLSGLAVAYRAYRLSLNGQEAPVIGGLTGDQRFFMGWAQVWRGKFRDEALRQQLITGPHSPGMYRTNGILSNMPEFYAAFGVQEGDGMYRPAEKRVKIW
jgi:putative endopeptidase